MSAPIARRALIGTALAAPAVLRARPAHAANVIKIGNITPLTGPLAAFGEANAFITAGVQKAIAGGISSGGQSWHIEFLTRDSQSSSSRASDLAAELINTDNVDMLVAAGGPDTTNPVADQAESNQVPCVTTACPWQAYFFGRHGNPAKPFTSTYHFCFGLDDVIAGFAGLWDTVTTNRKVGGIFANDADGNAWGDAKRGFPAGLPRLGYTLIDPGRYQPLASDFSAQIGAFKTAGVDIVTGTMLTADFITFWTQCAQLDFHPKIVTMGKALLFPSGIEAVGSRGKGLSSEIVWSSGFPFKSGLTGQSCADLAAAYAAATGKPYPQLMGLSHALFEVAIDVFKRAGTPHQANAVIAAIKATNYQSIAGPVNWNTGPLPNISRTPLVAGQWLGGPGHFALSVQENAKFPAIPVQSKLGLLA